MIYKNFIRRMNFVAYVMIALAAAILQTTIFNQSVFRWFHPDIVFILAVYFGYRKGVVEGGLLTALTAVMLEAISSAPSHFLLSIYIYTFVVAKVLSRIYVMKSLATASGIVAILYVFKQTGLFVLLSTADKGTNAFPNILLHLIPGLIAQVGLTPILFSIFHSLDLNTWSDIHAEDEYDLNKEL